MLFKINHELVLCNVNVFKELSLGKMELPPIAQCEIFENSCF